MSATQYGVTPQGFVAKPYPEILAELQAAYQSAFGATVDVSTNSPDGQLLAIFADRESSIWDGLEAVYAAATPDGASGTALDDLCAITGTQRQTQTYSSTPVQLIGAPGTLIPAGTVFSVSNNSSARFDLETAVTLPALWSPGATYALNQLISVVVNNATQSWECANPGTSVTAGTWTSGGNPAANAVIAVSRTDGNGTNYWYALAGGTSATGSLPANFAAASPTSPAYDGTGSTGVQWAVVWPSILLLDETITEPGGTVSWQYVSSLTSTSAGAQITGVAQAEQPGPVVALSGTLTTIETPVNGLATVTNTADATLGQLTETDAQLRIDREAELATAGNGTIDAITSHLDDIGIDSGVQTVTTFENDGDVPDSDGRPAHSFESVLVPNSAWTDIVTAPALSTAQQVANAIWKSKPAGIQTVSRSGSHTTSATVTDISGNSQTVGWSLPVEETIYVLAALELAPQMGYPSGGLTWPQVQGYIQAAQKALTTYAQGLPVGSSIYSGVLAAQLIPIYSGGGTTPTSGIAGLVNARILLGSSSGSYPSYEVDMSDTARDQPQVSSGNIAVALPWVAASPYVAGSVVTASVSGQACVFTCSTTTGSSPVSGGTQPSWNVSWTSGSPGVDSGIKWAFLTNV